MLRGGGVRDGGSRRSRRSRGGTGGKGGNRGVGSRGGGAGRNPPFARPWRTQATAPASEPPSRPSAPAPRPLVRPARPRPYPPRPLAGRRGPWGGPPRHRPGQCRAAGRAAAAAGPGRPARRALCRPKAPGFRVPGLGVWGFGWLRTKGPGRPATPALCRSRAPAAGVGVAEGRGDRDAEMRMWCWIRAGIGTRAAKHKPTHLPWCPWRPESVHRTSVCECYFKTTAAARNPTTAYAHPHMCSRLYGDSYYRKQSYCSTARTPLGHSPSITLIQSYAPGREYM
jgi:hypothetical protein